MPEQIQKIKINKHRKAELQYTRSLPNGELEKCLADEPMQSAPDALLDAMNALLPTVAEALRLADDWLDDDAIALGTLWVSGVTLKPVEHEYGVTITAQLKVDSDDQRYTAVVNTPYLSPDHLTQAEQVMIQALVREAIAYLNSRPAQLSLAIAPDAERVALHA